MQVDTGDAESERITEFFQITDDNVPAVRLINLDEDMKKYLPEFTELTADNIRSWAQDYLDGKLKVRERESIGKVGEGTEGA